MKNRLKKCSGFVFLTILFPFSLLHPQTLGPPKPIQKDYKHNVSNNNVFRNHNVFNHSMSEMHNTFYSSRSTNRYVHFLVLVDSASTLKTNQLRLKMKEVSDSFLPKNQICSDLYEDSLILSMKDTVDLMRSVTFKGLTSKKIPLLLKMPSLLKLDAKPSAVCLSKKKMLHFGIYSSLGFFYLPESGAFGGVYKILGITLWQNIAERIKIHEKLDFQFAKSWVLKKDILREYYTNGEVSGYRHDISEKYTFNGATISVDIPFGLIYSSRAFLYLYYGFGAWYAKQHYKCIRSDTYQLITEEDMSLVHTQTIKPINSVGILLLTRNFKESRLKAITFDLVYRYARNEKAMNSSFFMDIDSFTHMWLIGVGFML